MALPNLRLIAAATALLGAFAAGWVGQGWRLQAALDKKELTHAQQLQAIAAEATQARATVQKQERQMAAQLAELDKQKMEEINAAKSETNRLRRCIAAGTCGVRLNSTAGAASSRGAADAAAPGVDNAAPALDAALQQRVLDLRDAIAEDSAALEYLQGYAKRCLIGAQAVQ